MDTSTLIDLKGFPRDIFEVWGSIEDLIEKDLLIAPKQVREELKAWDDELHPWAVRHKRMFRVLTREQAKCVAEIVAEFPELAHMERRVEAADPFVIALALAEKRVSLFGTDYIVVTSERRKRGKKNMPRACDHFGLRCLGLFDFMRAEGWSFVRDRGE